MSLKYIGRLYIESKDDKFVYHFIITKGAIVLLKYYLNQSTIWICIILMCNLLSCSESSSSGSSADGELFIKLHDAPANYDHMYISVVAVSIYRADDNLNFSWSTVNTEDVTDVDLLNLRNGISEPLVMSKVRAGKYEKIKLRFGACSIVESGNPHPLNFNFATQPEFTYDYNFEVLQGERTQLSVDFNIPGSISKGGFFYYFTPDIRVQNTSLCGWISGSILDTTNGRSVIPSTIFTWTGLDSVSTLNETVNGSFQLSDLPENYYSIWIVPLDSVTFQPKTIDSLRVIRQQATLVGNVYLKRR
jgi:hypothetical protein